MKGDVNYRFSRRHEDNNFIIALICEYEKCKCIMYSGYTKNVVRKAKKTGIYLKWCITLFNSTKESQSFVQS